MSKEISEKAELLLDKLIDGLEMGLEKLPDTAHLLLDEYTKYFILREIPFISFLFTITGFLASYFLIVRLKGDLNDSSEVDQNFFKFCSIFVVIFSLIPLCFFVEGLVELFSWYVAPHASLIEEWRK